MNKYEKEYQVMYAKGFESDLLKELVERATPKKTKCDTPFHDIPKCPNCNNELYYRYNQPHCDSCGQALKWTDKE